MNHQVTVTFAMKHILKFMNECNGPIIDGLVKI